jgi:uncharacterized circularly permuted ATP-grasp superfamily protein
MPPGPGVLKQRQERVRRMRHEDGATYNPFDDPFRTGNPWALEMIPLPLTAGEWAGLEAGLIQRAVCWNDPGGCLRPPEPAQKGTIPPELISPTPIFCGPATVSTRRQPLSDLLRRRPLPGPGRTFPGAAGLRRQPGRPGLRPGKPDRHFAGFSRTVPPDPDPPLAPFFHTFHQQPDPAGPSRREDPGIVLLSPGPDSRIYFEHALLSRYLGYPLVEGQDLTVRNGRCS